MDLPVHFVAEWKPIYVKFGGRDRTFFFFFFFLFFFLYDSSDFDVIFWSKYRALDGVISSNTVDSE
jgi:hypothetical protein